MGKRILIVEDDPSILSLLVIRLKNTGYEVLAAASSEEALGLVGKSVPDLILLDLLLPDMQGEEFCRRIKSDKKLKEIPVIIMTAHTARIEETVGKIRADDYVTKPFEPAELLAKIEKLTIGK